MKALLLAVGTLIALYVTTSFAPRFSAMATARWCEDASRKGCDKSDTVFAEPHSSCCCQFHWHLAL